MKNWLKFTPAIAIACTLTTSPLLTISAEEIEVISEKTAESTTTLTGKLLLPSGKDFKFTDCKVTISRSPDFSPLMKLFPSEKFENLKGNEKNKAIQEWFKTDAGKEYTALGRKISEQRFSVTVTPDDKGNFTAPNLAKGRYSVSSYIPHMIDGKATSDKAAEKMTSLKLTGEATHKMEDIQLVVIANPKIGEMAPTFAIKTVHGKEFKLEDLRGKFVLIDFWAVWCGPCRGETPNVKAVYDEFGGDRFEVLALSLDNETAEPIKYAKDHDLKYMQGFLGKWGDDHVTKLYGIKGIPSMWLIDPDGKIVAKGLRGAKIHSEVKKALEADAKAKKI